MSFMHQQNRIRLGRWILRKGKIFPSLWFCAIPIFPEKVEQGKKFQRLSKVKIVKNLQKYLSGKGKQNIAKSGSFLEV